MPKLGMQPIRQRQIIDAAIRTIHSEGIGQASIRQIGLNVGISPSLVTHYFGTREQLFVEVLKHLNKQMARITAERLRQASTPLDRMWAIAAAQFDSEHFEPVTVGAWFALWSKLPEIPAMQRYQDIYERRLTSNIRHAMRPLVPPGQLDFAVDSVLAMIDGLWVKAAQPTSRIDREAALRIFRALVLMLIEHLPARPLHDT